MKAINIMGIIIVSGIISILGAIAFTPTSTSVADTTTVSAPSFVFSPYDNPYTISCAHLAYDIQALQNNSASFLSGDMSSSYYTAIVSVGQYQGFVSVMNMRMSADAHLSGYGSIVQGIPDSEVC